MSGVPTHSFPVGVPGYQSLGLLGQGASGQVFKARQRSTGQFVAIKIPSTPSIHDPATRRRVYQRLHQETRVLAMLQHAHVVRLIDKGIAQGGLIFAVLEFIPGETLRDFLRHNGRMSLLDTLNLMVQLLDVLASLHKHGIVHRDIKPENVMVVPTGASLHAKVFDFGLASHHGEHILLTGAEGTPAYCAPEQLRGEVSVPASDIYAWALMFVECLNASPCFQGTTVSEVVQQQLSNTPVVLPEERLGHSLTGLLRRALHKEVSLRAANAAHLYDELMQSLMHLRTDQHSPGTPSLQPARATRFALEKPLTIDPITRINTVHQVGDLCRIMVCLTMRIYPAQNAGIVLSDLQDMREQQMQWCLNAVQAERGLIAGTLGDCMLFLFEKGTGSRQNFQQAAMLALKMSTLVQRRSRVLSVQHGVRLEISGAIHKAPLLSEHGTSGYNQAVNLALHLNSLAEPGAIIVSPSAYSELVGSVAMEEYVGIVRARQPEVLHRLVATPDH